MEHAFSVEGGLAARLVHMENALHVMRALITF